MPSLAEKLLANPPLTRAMLGVLDHDDDIDPKPACDALGIQLTPLDETLLRCVGPGSEERMSETAAPARPRRGALLRRVLPWLITLLCFASST